MIKKGFTLIELLVVIAIIALLLSIIIPATRKAKEMASGISCLANMRSIGQAFHMYQHENSGWLVTGAAWWTPQEFDPDDSLMVRQRAWVCGPMDDNGDPVRLVEDRPTIENEINGIKEGRLWEFIEDESAYHCPGDKRIVKEDIGWRSYSMVAGLGAQYYQYISSDQSVHKMSQIKSPGEKYFLLEEVEKLPDGSYWWSMGSWVLDLLNNNWYDPIADWHNEGCNLAYADGHVEKYKWKDQRTIDWIEGTAEKSPSPAEHAGSADLEYMLSHYLCKR